MDMRPFSGRVFLKLDDIRAGQLELEIADAKPGKYGKPDLYFRSGEILSLNATNCRTLIQAYGPDSTDWVGKQIRLVVGEVEYQGRLQDGIIVEPISPALRATDRAEAAHRLGDFDRSDLDDNLADTF
jgi:hypothetical protein